jgi:hypothetical protein
LTITSVIDLIFDHFVDGQKFHDSVIASRINSVWPQMNYFVLVWIILIFGESVSDLRETEGKSSQPLIYSISRRCSKLNNLRGGIGTPEPDEWRQQAYDQGCKSFDPANLDNEEEIYQPKSQVDSTLDEPDRDPYGLGATSMGRSQHKIIPNFDSIGRNTLI